MTANERRKLRRELVTARVKLTDLERRLVDNCALAQFVMFWQFEVAKLEHKLTPTKPATAQVRG